MGETKQIGLAGFICIVLGASVCLIAFRVLPYDESKIHAPGWIIALCGGVFVLGGLALLLRSHKILVSVLGNCMVLIFGIVAGWIALFGQAEQFSGGIPLLSNESNVSVARALFFCVAIMCALILTAGLRYLVRQLANAEKAGSPD